MNRAFEVFTAILFMEALIGGLCILILFVRQYLCRWPEFKLILNGLGTYNVPGGQSLAAAVRSVGFFLPSSCGGRGTCGICKIKVLHGGGALGLAERTSLSSADLNSGMRLACQVRIHNDIEAELLPQSASAVLVKSVVAAKTQVTDKIYKLLLHVLEPNNWSFKAGQYIQVFKGALKVSEEPIARAYSIASDPAAADNIELHIQRVSGGELSPWLCERSAGDEIWFSGPYGEMVLPDFSSGADETELLCVAGGVGFAPMKAIILAVAALKKPCKLELFWGMPSKSDLYEHEWLLQKAAEFAWFIYVPCVEKASAESAASEAELELGLVTEVLERRIEISKPTLAFLCGPEAMVVSARAILEKKGLAPSNIFSDSL